MFSAVQCAPDNYLVNLDGKQLSSLNRLAEIHNGDIGEAFDVLDGWLAGVRLQMRQCDHCHRWFAPKRKGQRYCPPVVGKNSRCGQNARMKERRRTQKAGQSTTKRLMTVPTFK